MKKKNVVVIGAGFGGLAVAALLSHAGFHVTVIEQNSQPGGRAGVLRAKGFTFDMGPSWYLMPEVFERFFAVFDKKPADYYTLKRLDPSYRMFFGKDDVPDIKAQLKDNLKLFDTIEKDGSKKFKRYFDQSKKLYEIAVQEFMYSDTDSFKSFFNKRVLKEGRGLPILEDMDSYAKKFFSSDKLRKIVEYTIVFLGGSPTLSPALFSMLTYVDFHLGVWYPMGGVGKVVQAMYMLGKSENVTFRFNTKVKKIEIRSGEASRVKTTKGDVDADIVISNADYPHTETTLLDKKYQTYNKSYWEKKTIAPSGFVLYLGLRKKLKNLHHHNLFLYHDWMNHFDSIFKNKNTPTWPSDPSYYVCVPSKSFSIVAPTTYENVFILVPIAAGLHDSDRIRENYAQKIIKHLESIIGESIADSIEYKKIFSPRDFISRYNAYKGSALGLTHTLWQSAWFRPRHKSKKIKNLYYVGQYTHPGIGVPTSIISGHIVAKKVIEEYGR